MLTSGFHTSYKKGNFITSKLPLCNIIIHKKGKTEPNLSVSKKNPVNALINIMTHNLLFICKSTTR